MAEENKVPDIPVQSRLDNGELVEGWKSQVNKLIESEPDTMVGLINLFLQIGAALENAMPLEKA